MTSDPQWHFLRMLQSWTWPNVSQGDAAIKELRTLHSLRDATDAVSQSQTPFHGSARTVIEAYPKAGGHDSLLQQTCKHDNFATFGCMITSRTVLFGWKFSSCLPNPASIVFASSIKAFLMACAACRKDRMALTRVDGLLQWMIFPAKARINSRLKRLTQVT